MRFTDIQTVIMQFPGIHIVSKTDFSYIGVDLDAHLGHRLHWFKLYTL